jgi:hypothetical protein
MAKVSLDECSILGQGGSAATFDRFRVGSMSIDSTEDGGFLNCMVRKYLANFYCYTHFSAAQALFLLRVFPPLGTGVAVLAGHGMPGIIICGTGDKFDKNSPRTYLGLANYLHWKKQASTGIRAKRLVLTGCHTGQGVKGAKLLNLLASSLRIPVSAWTGLVWCGPQGTWGEGKLVTATPRAPAAAVPRKEIWTSAFFMMSMKLAVATPTGFEEFSIDQVVALRLSSCDLSSDAVSSIHFEGPEIREAIGLVDFNHPFSTKARPASIMIGRLKISYYTDDVLTTRTFRVLGPSLIQDELFQDVFYHASPALSGLILAK